ncbi:RNA polymerase sigma factor, partial [Collinsella stercoris]|uniref:RNA polymerase sigma factor n=1 Tax=Collinsella stercoris TaxID=147206 RepID=UPI00248DDB01
MGKPIVISDVIERYRDTVFRLAFTYLRNQADADDVTQDVFVKLIRSSHDFESDEHLRRWLIRMTINECKSLFRKPWRRIDDIEDYANTIAMPTPEHTDLFVRVMSLPERYRVPLVLYYYLGFSTNETANLLKIPAATVRTRLARGDKRKRRGTARPIAAVAAAALIATAGVGGTAYAVINSDFFQTALGDHGLGTSSQWTDSDTGLSYRRDHGVVGSDTIIENYESAVEPVNYVLEAHGYTLNVIDMVIDKNACGIVRFTLDCPTGLGINTSYGAFNQMVFDNQDDHLALLSMETRAGTFLDTRCVYDVSTLTDTHLEGTMYFTPIIGTFDEAKSEVLSGVRWEMAWNDGDDLHPENAEASTDLFVPSQIVETRRFTHGSDAIADLSPFSIHYVADK